MTDPAKFAAYLASVISPAVLGILTQSFGGDELKAFDVFYASRVYAALSDEQTKVWHFSPELIASLVDEEVRSGSFSFPEEAS